VEVVTSSSVRLRFTDGTPVRAASAVARLGEGWLIAQDDATHGCWWRGSTGTPLRLLPPVDGQDSFSEQAGTKHLKPDLEAACEVDGGVLLLGSGSTPARMRSVLLAAPGATPLVHALGAGYAAVAHALGLSPDQLNLEGAFVVGDHLRWFQRGLPAAGVPSASADVDLADLLAGRVRVVGLQVYDLGPGPGADLAVTDAVALDDGRVLVSAVAEASPTTYDDGPVSSSALVLLDGGRTVASVPFPRVDGRVVKVEGLAVVDQRGDVVRLVGCVDADDPTEASLLLTLDVRVPARGGSQRWE
jgi:hypothetical protein